MRVGVVFSGGQAPGGHNVVTGLFDALKELHKENRLFGFLGGPSGIVSDKKIELTLDTLKNYRNQGGFDLLGSGRTKIETLQQLQGACKSCKDLQGLVIIGGDDSNTNAALLAEHFLQENIDAKVVGIPKTIDGDLKNEHIEIPFGFDTACKVYAELIGNIERDALSSKKYTHFIRLMGRSASHITLECALTSYPNIALFSEEVASKKMTLDTVASYLAEKIQKRRGRQKEYGVILIPEGLIEFIPEVKTLISELNALLAKGSFAFAQLSNASQRCYQSLPEGIQKQLLLDRDPHGNVQVSKIETEKLLAEMVRKKLGTLSTVEHFFGYEGRSALPSNFDANYCYALGYMGALLIQEGVTGYIACIGNLHKKITEWKVKGVPLTSMLHIESRHGKDKAVIKKALVDLKGAPFAAFKMIRSKLEIEDHYRYMGPIQYYGSSDLVNSVPLSILYNYK